MGAVGANPFCAAGQSRSDCKTDGGRQGGGYIFFMASIIVNSQKYIKTDKIYAIRNFLGST